MSPRTGIAVAVGVFLLVLTLQNTEVITVSVLFWNARAPLVVLVLLAAAAGFVLGLAVGWKRTSARRPPSI